MSHIASVRVAAAAFLLALATAAWGQQQNNPPAPPAGPAASSQHRQPDCSGSGKGANTSTCPPADGKQPPQQDKQASGGDNAFPAAESQKAADAANGKQDTGNSSAAKDNPFPMEQSQKAQQQANPPAAQNDPNSSSSRTNLDRLDLLGNRNGVTGYGDVGNAYDPKQAKKDNQVGDFYMNTGDYQGAYDRFQEATHIDPGNAEAVFDLAEAARNLGRNQVAVQNYQIYLQALPKGPHAKDARKALKQLGAGK